jgi:hypothetical protein
MDLQNNEELTFRTAQENLHVDSPLNTLFILLQILMDSMLTKQIG